MGDRIVDSDDEVVQSIARGDAATQPPRAAIAFGGEVPAHEHRDSRPRVDLRAAGAALLIHLAVFAALSAKGPPPEPVPPGAMEVTYLTLPGAPPEGDPTGSPDPVDPGPDRPKAATPPAPRISPEATPDPKPETPPAPDAPVADTADQKPATNDPAPPTDQPGSGAIALGAKSHGDAQGLDAGLVATVGQAVATRIRTCWTPPTAGVASGRYSTIVVRYAPDGSVEGDPRVVRIVDEREVPVDAPDALEAAAVDAIRRCSPIGLPKAIYPYWREVDVQLFSAMLPTPTIRP